MSEDLDDAPFPPRGPPAHFPGAQAGDGARKLCGRRLHQRDRIAPRAIPVNFFQVSLDLGRDLDAARLDAARLRAARAWESFHKVPPLLVGFGLPFAAAGILVDSSAASQESFEREGRSRQGDWFARAPRRRDA